MFFLLSSSFSLSPSLFLSPMPPFSFWKIANFNPNSYWDFKIDQILKHYLLGKWTLFFSIYLYLSQQPMSSGMEGATKSLSKSSRFYI